jgi:NitT/TauT family transport system permease protein
MPSTWRNRLIGAASVALLVALWQAVSSLIGLEIILPGPAATFARLGLLLASPGFVADVAATVTRGLVGFGISAGAALALGVAAGRSTTVFVALQPLVALLRATPVMSVILLAMIWFRTEGMPVFVAFLMCFPVLYGNVVEGIRSLDRDLVDMAHVFRVRRPRILASLYLPAILPYLVAGFSSTLGLSWKVVVAAEVLAQPGHAIGTRLQDSRVMLDTSGVLAWTAVALLLSAATEGLLRVAARRLRSP